MSTLNRTVVQTGFEIEIQARIDAERARLRAEVGPAHMDEFENPMERGFTPSERDRVRFLFGGLTSKRRTPAAVASEQVA